LNDNDEFKEQSNDGVPDKKEINRNLNTPTRVQCS